MHMCLHDTDDVEDRFNQLEEGRGVNEEKGGSQKCS